MDFTSQFIFGIGALLVVSVLASRISERFDAPLLLVFLLLGMLLGAEGLGLAAFIETEFAFLAASLALAVILFVINLCWSLWKGKPADANPWQAQTLEWTIESPSPHGNFVETPKVSRGPYEYGGPVDQELITQSGPMKDFG
jgi:heme/copper-type cytochrome/quinol oxidase subunit 1